MECDCLNCDLGDLGGWGVIFCGAMLGARGGCLNCDLGDLGGWGVIFCGAMLGARGVSEL